MSIQVPFCERCGRPGVTLSGLHPAGNGLLRWTLFRCGHLRTEAEGDISEVGLRR